MKVLITVDAATMEVVDRIVSERGISRSTYFMDAVRHELQRSNDERAANISRGVAKLRAIARRYPTQTNSTDDIRAQRDAR